MTVTDLKYAFFLGCAIPYREMSYEVSARRIAKSLDISLVEMTNFNCCGLPVEPVNHEMTLALAARNLCVAEQLGLDIVTLCNGCTGVLMKTNKKLKTDKKLREKVNGYLKEIGMEFQGKINVKHLVHVLVEEIGLDNLKKKITRSLKNLKIAGFTGCHLFRPSKYLGEANPSSPSLLNDLIDLTGANRVNYVDEFQCCGYSCSGIESELPIILVREKLRNIKSEGVDGIVTICPSCHIVFDVNQRAIERSFSESYGIPVLHYPQLLGLAMGIDPDELALKDLRTKPTELIKTINET